MRKRKKGWGSYDDSFLGRNSDGSFRYLEHETRRAPPCAAFFWCFVASMIFWGFIVWFLFVRPKMG